MKLDVVFCGVGGQGVVVLSDIYCEAAMLDGFDVAKAEIHGMAQRGGSIVAYARIGDATSRSIQPSHERFGTCSGERPLAIRLPECKRHQHRQRNPGDQKKCHCRERSWLTPRDTIDKGEENGLWFE